MARKQLKKHRLVSSERPSSTAPNSSQGASHPSADAPSTAGTSANTSRKLFSRMGYLFHRSNQTRSEPSTTETTDTRIGNKVNVAQQAMVDMKPTPQVLQTAVGVVGQADTAVTKIQNIEAILQPLKLFNSCVTTLSNVHPYIQFALGILTAASQLLINQANLDNEVFGLLNTVKDLYEFLMEKDTIENMDNMKETLRKISQEMSAAALFVIKYCKKKNILIRIGDSLVSDPQTVARGHIKNLGDLMQQYRDRAIRDIQINMNHVLEDLNLEGMAYAAGAGLNTTKKCLDGTRTEILKDITDWITTCDVNAPRILWLHGQAGRGKSAIAHTIASWMEDVGAPGACFCFARDRRAERREEKVLTTIARDLADRDPAFRRALSNVVSNNLALKTTCDVVQQWKRFILEPLSKISGEIVGNVVVIIDALDESGPEKSRKDILGLLKSSEAAHLPANFRILLTSRPLPDIARVMRDVPHVKATSLDDVRWELVEHDIRLYVSKELDCLSSIGATEVQNVIRKSDGLFEWARLACEFIRTGRAGETWKECYDDLMALESEEGRTLLDTTYFAILKGSIPQSGKRLERYRSVMQQVVMTVEPLPMAALNSMREKFPNKQDRYDVILILEFMSPVLGGIVDRVSAVRPLHASFYDFLMDRSRSGVYSIETSDAQHSRDLAFASLQILHDNLQFNICGLESSYLANAEVSDLLKRIKEKIPHHLSYSSRFWGQHLWKTPFDLQLAGLVRAIVGSEKILFWLEVLSLLGMVGKGVDILSTVATWLWRQDGFKDVLALIEDGIKLIRNFGSMIVHSTPHLSQGWLELL
ncbi:hypothetical protein M404DRAFT_1005115 [Pisolithus tinctorius Marx 270]|uniref:NACHT domain-containing protein n=1 Tax=Pisolithus tinctorius Marx 270 TaxID=870435 RepID=A0A0C3IPA6_PISTI|nr:hypothetical protein M404DRAFT_1005115 [Pisolithus tinctorius Marx 270]